MEILLSGRPIPATQALDLGLVHAIVPNEDFEDHCLDAARRFLTLSAGIIPYAKEVLCPFPKELAQFLEIEASAVLSALYAKGGGAEDSE
jgi:enoyl-CoA hydratase/carnithine racemase